MKQLIMITALLLLAANPVLSQTQAPSALGLYASVGVRGVNAHHSLFESTKNPTWATTLGAGSSWRKNTFQLGTEFYYSTAPKEEGDVLVNYSGFNSTLFAASKILQRHDWSLYSSLGIGVSTSRLMFSEKSNAEGQTLHSSIYTQEGVLVLPAIIIEHTNAKGIFMGLNLGYGFSMKGKQAWEQEGSGYKTPFRENPSGFYIQLKSGGLLQLTGKL